MEEIVLILSNTLDKTKLDESKKDGGNSTDII